jgi:hypothetical protein
MLVSLAAALAALAVLRASERAVWRVVARDGLELDFELISNRITLFMGDEDDD